jgi:hypothetical protein
VNAQGRKERLLTLACEVACGVAVAFVVVVYAMRGPFLWMPQRKWVSLAILSCAIFGTPLWWYRQNYRNSFFWLVFVALFLLHIFAFSVYLSSEPDFPPLLLPLSILLESAIVFPLLRLTTKQRKPFKD